jgi:glyoxylase-like metal-dependent hydrolase (beta-lactamase superfamily II)
VTLVVRPSRYLHYNAGAFVSAGEACLVDPGILPEETEALLRETGGARLGHIVLTHADWDHVLGPEHLPPATIVAHAAYEKDLDPDGVRVVLGKLEARAGVTRSRPFEPPRPTVTFEDTTQLVVGELELRLEHAPGHTESMLTVYEPEGQQLWAADVLSDVEIPSIIHDLESYEHTLARIAELPVRMLVPGHGTPTENGSEIRQRLEDDRRYLDQLHTAVHGAVTAGNSLAETLDLCESVDLRRAEEDATTHRLNVEKVYADLGGDANPDAVGFARAWKEATGTSSDR